MAKRWYSVSVLSNYEKKIAETIRQSAIDSSMEEQIEEVLGRIICGKIKILHCISISIKTRQLLLAANRCQ